MSFFKHRFGSTDLSGHPLHPRLGDDPASPSSADSRQPPDPSLSEVTPAAAARQADLVCLADIEPRPIDRPIGAGLPLRKLAAGWLRDYLSDGQRSQYNVETAAQRDGICIRTLRRAKFDLGVVSTKESISGCWNWALPEDEELVNA
jgi:hypothetical protein